MLDDELTSRVMYREIYRFDGKEKLEEMRIKTLIDEGYLSSDFEMQSVILENIGTPKILVYKNFWGKEKQNEKRYKLQLLLRF